MYSSSDFEGHTELPHEDIDDHAREENPEAVGDNPEEDERVPVVVTRLAPSATVILQVTNMDQPSVSMQHDKCVQGR